MSVDWPRRWQAGCWGSISSYVGAFGGLVLLTAATVLAQGQPSVAATGECLLLERSVELPPALRRVRDIRWAGGDSLYLSAGDIGVVKFEPFRTEAPIQTLIPDARPPAGIWIPWEIGSSSERLAVGGAVYELGWRRAPPAGSVGVEGRESYDVVFDLDVDGDRLLVLGLGRGPDQRLAPRGELAWLGTLAQGFRDRRPVFFSSGGEGAPSADACLHMDFGSVRFLPGGEFVVLPHFEEGVFWYDRAGVLVRTWTSAEVGFASGCPVSEEEKYRLSVDEEGRWNWVNKRQTVDDILPFHQGAGVVIRTVIEGRVEWSLALLRRDGRIERCRIPFTAPAPTAHLRGDVSRERVALLVHVLHQRGTVPKMEPRVLFLKPAGWLN